MGMANATEIHILATLENKLHFGDVQLKNKVKQASWKYSLRSPELNSFTYCQGPWKWHFLFVMHAYGRIPFVWTQHDFLSVTKFTNMENDGDTYSGISDPWIDGELCISLQFSFCWKLKSSAWVPKNNARRLMEMSDLSMLVWKVCRGNVAALWSWNHLPFTWSSPLMQKKQELHI